MITTGFIREAAFIVSHAGKDLNFRISSEIEFPMMENIDIFLSKEGIMSISYNNDHIWKEDLGEHGFFGVESTDSISRIIACINNSDNSWKEKYPSPL